MQVGCECQWQVKHNDESDKIINSQSKGIYLTPRPLALIIKMKA